MADQPRTGDATSDAGRDFLPVWFADRLSATGRFGVLLVTRQILIVDGVRTVRRTADGTVWIDAEIVVPHRKDGFPWGHFPVIKSTGPDRAMCSLNAAHIVAIVEVDPWELPPLEPLMDAN